MNELEKLLAWVNSCDWFIFSKDDCFVVVPAMTKLDSNGRMLNTWRILPNTQTNSQRVMIPSVFYGREYPKQENDYVKNYNLPKEFSKFGFESCGLCHGLEMEEKHPVLFEDISKYKAISDMSVNDKIWALANMYSVKIAEQYDEFCASKRNGTKTIHIDRLGSPF